MEFTSTENTANFELNTKKFKFDLSGDIESYLPVLANKKEAMTELIENLKQTDYFAEAAKISKVFFKKYSEADLKRDYGHIADVLYLTAKEFSLSIELLVTAFIAFDTIVACTSIGLIDKNGEVLLGRNLDLPFVDLLLKLIEEIEFYNKGEKLFSAVTLGGFGTFLNVYKKNEFCISVNKRFGTTTKQIIKQIKAGSLLSGSLLYFAALEGTEEGVLNKLRDCSVSSNIYWIVAGKSQVVLFEKNSGEKCKMFTTETKNSFLAVANEDKGKPSERKEVAENVLGSSNLEGEELLQESLWTPPVVNDMTIYTYICRLNKGVSVYTL